VDQDNPKLGTGKLIVHVQDKAKKPVEGAKVTVALSMPKHEHGAKPVELNGGKHGEYSTGIQHLGMPGDYRADVAVVVNGDTVKQAFSFAK
jgi:nitrogen fixation protein FixH